MFGFFKKDSKESKVDPKKLELIQKGKELGINLTQEMSMYELEHRISEAEEESKKVAESNKRKSTVKSSKRGEY